jgi:hypothetical protein
VFKPSEQEFADPVTYIEGLMRNKNAIEFGCVKIIPPDSFKPPLAFDVNSSQRLLTRYQVLGKLQ